MTDQAVVLAAGRGTRMRRPQHIEKLTTRQAEVASNGLKAMMPVGRPFIDYVLSGLADAGYRHACRVSGSNHDMLREHVRNHRGGRLEIQFCIQQEALGTAHALAAAKDSVGAKQFLLINSDIYYPISALEGLRLCSGSAVV